MKGFVTVILFFLFALAFDVPFFLHGDYPIYQNFVA